MKMRIVALGDSITEGYPYSLRESWVHFAAEALNIDIINEGICGNMTSEMLKRFQRNVVAYAPSHVIILGGGNDAAYGYSLNDVKENFEGMVALCRKHHIIPILGIQICSLDAAHERTTGKYRDWLREYAEKENLLHIDFYAPFFVAMKEGRATELFSDAVHPSVKGYRLMGETAVQFLRSLTEKAL